MREIAARVGAPPAQALERVERLLIELKQRQQELDAIKATLGQVISQESVTLTSTEEDLVRRLLRTTDSAVMLMLKV